MQKKIKIFVSNRIDLDAASFDSTILKPVRCGAVYDDRKGLSILGDNTGNNISERRNTFCELTVQYWAWKNEDADYYGLFHYRRFFNFSGHYYPEDGWGNVIDECINDETAQIYGINDDRMRSVIEKYDVIVPAKKNVTHFPSSPKSVWDHWCLAPDLHEEDLRVLLNVIAKLQPDYYQIAKKYLKGKYAYFCAMHIMKKELFQSYCEWLYPILFELEQEIDISTYTVEGQRTVGHLAERLLGIYIFYLQETQPQLRIKELQTVLFTKPQATQEVLSPAFKDAVDIIPVVFAANSAFAPVCSVAINSIIQNANTKSKYDIVVLESDISAKDKKTIKSLASNLENFSIRFYNVQSIISKYNLVANEHITIETYFRFLIQDILPEYDKVLYLDGDIVCNRDVADLYHLDIDGYMLAAAKDPDMCGQLNLPHSDRIRYLKGKLHMKNPYDYFQAGVLLLNTKEMRGAYTMNEWLTFAQTRYMYSDQDVLNRYCQGRVFYFDMAWNMLIDCENYRVPVVINAAVGDVYREYHKARKNPFIIHFAGHQKPWNQKNVDFEDEFWKYARTTPYYEMLLMNAMTGSVYDAARQLPPIGVSDALKNYLKKKAKKWCPLGTWRYYFASKVLSIYRRFFRR